MGGTCNSQSLLPFTYLLVVMAKIMYLKAQLKYVVYCAIKFLRFPITAFGFTVIFFPSPENLCDMKPKLTCINLTEFLFTFQMITPVFDCDRKEAPTMMTSKKPRTTSMRILWTVSANLEPTLPLKVRFKALFRPFGRWCGSKTPRSSS